MTDCLKVCGVFLLLVCASCRNGNTRETSVNHGDSVLLSVKTIPVNDGWGYEIFAGNKLYIKQNIVPQISGIHHFLTEEDARKAANLVVKKLVQEQSPTIDTTELQAVGARYR